MEKEGLLDALGEVVEKEKIIDEKPLCDDAPEDEIQDLAREVGKTFSNSKGVGGYIEKPTPEQEKREAVAQKSANDEMARMIRERELDERIKMVTSNRTKVTEQKDPYEVITSLRAVLENEK